MSKNALMAIMLVISVSIIAPVYAEVISMSTDKHFYKKGDSIIFSGKTDELPNPINIVFVDPEGKKQITGTSINSTGYFEKTIKTDDSAWKNFFTIKGIYNVTAFLNTEKFDANKVVRFDFSLDGSPVVPSAFNQTGQQSQPQPPKQTTSSQQQSTQSNQANTDLTKEFLQYVDPKENPQSYIDRYISDSAYKAWFDTNFPGLDIYTVLGVSKTSTPQSKSEPTPESPAKEPEPSTSSEPQKEPEATSKLAPFVDPKKDPQSYIDRYNNEPTYKAWFDKNFPGITIYEAVGLEPPKVKKLAPFVDPKKDPQSYIDRYNNEPTYKAWFDKNFPDITIYEAVGLEPPKVGTCGLGTEFKDGVCIAKTETKKTGGGCLIATATYGSELAPQVQQLRELRDNSLLKTESGTSFMKSFNEFYYSFSPTISDLERENPAFKEAVKIAITPMMSTLSILNHVDLDSEAKVVGYGLAIISLNVGMYLLAPAIVVYKIRRYF